MRWGATLTITRPFEVDLACVLEYCTDKASIASRALHGWESLVTLSCALLAAVAEGGDAAGMAAARQWGPQLLAKLREGVVKHCKAEDAPRLQWTLCGTQGLVGGG